MPNYKDLVEEYQNLNQTLDGRAFTVFVGDSITKRFNIYEFFKRDNILNRGIYSDNTLGILKRLNNTINNINIDKLFIMIGHNDLKYRSNDEIISNIIEIVRLSSAKLIFVQSILPVDSSRKNDNLRIDQINKKLKIAAIGHNYIFINLNDKFKDKMEG